MPIPAHMPSGETDFPAFMPAVGKHCGTLIDTKNAEAALPPRFLFARYLLRVTVQFSNP